VGVFTQLEAVKARGLTPDQLQLSVEEAMSYETICLDIATPLHRIRSTKRVPAPHRTSSARFSRAYRA
jgi:hypothetical protein